MTNPDTLLGVSTSKAAQTTSPAPISPEAVQHPEMSGGAKAAIALGVILLLGTLAFWASFFLRRRKKSSLPRGIQPAMPFDPYINRGARQAELVATEKPFDGNYSTTAASLRKEVIGTTVAVQTQDFQSPAPQYRPSPQVQDNYLPLVLPELPAREASPRPGTISGDFMTPTSTNTNAAEMPANAMAVPYVWTRGRTLSRDAVELPAN
jgi:hypothetical protein